MRGYRLFDDLTLPRLGRVNLITGKNNTGKSTLLEAIRLYAYRGSPHVLLEILEGRDELQRRSFLSTRDLAGAASAVERVFTSKGTDDLRFSIEPATGAPSLSVTLDPFGSIDQTSTPEQLPLDGLDSVDVPDIRPLLRIQWADRRPLTYVLDPNYRPRRMGQSAEFFAGILADMPVCTFVSATGLAADDLLQLWNAVDLTALEETVVEALRLISPDVERVSVTTSESGRRPLVRAKLAESAEPVSLRSLGDGLNRIFGIALALVNSRDGFLLVDEVENGIHYSVQPDMWKLLFEVAARLNVQVFATTHSYDCVLAFQEAARSHPEEGVLVRLERKQDRFRVTTFAEDELEVVAREEIEVR
ncbi:MAG: AAA family ATPase [Armatimonadota bacterium]